MKHGWVLAFLLVPYGSLIPTSGGNPNDSSYNGQSGGVYDSAANPAKTVGVVTYDPYAPLPASASSASMPGPVTAAPATR